MEPIDVNTLADFCYFVTLLVEENDPTYEGTLEEYLRALWGQIQQHRENKVTFAFIGQLLQDAFTSKPLPFDDTWFTYESPPDMNKNNLDEFVALQHMICYQIADLRRMTQAGILDKPYIYLGVASPTGHSWYNFDPITYLRCAISPIAQIATDSNSPYSSWDFLTSLLWLGQIYE